MSIDPKFCPWCGAYVHRYGHDTDCDRPEEVVMHIEETYEMKVA